MLKLFKIKQLKDAQEASNTVVSENKIDSVKKLTPLFTSAYKANAVATGVDSRLQKKQVLNTLV